jgi:hypothetical protein
MSRRPRRPRRSLALAAALATLAACGGSSSSGNDPATVSRQYDYGQPSYTVSPPHPAYARPTTASGYGNAPPSPTAQLLAPVTTTDPAELSTLVRQAQAAPAADLESADQSSGDPLAAGIKLVAAKVAPDMKAEGQLAHGKLATGGHLSFAVSLAPGKCYALVGYAAPNTVKNLDLNLLAPPLYNVLAGQDGTDDNTPVIGKSPNPMCPVTPIELSYKVDIVARTGAGNVGVQLYSKAK